MREATLTRVTHEAVELERRQGGGQRVRMLWVAAADQVLIEQTTFRDSGDTVTLRCPPKARVLYAFEYPERFDEIEVDYRYQVTAGQMPRHVSSPSGGEAGVPASSSSHGRSTL